MYFPKSQIKPNLYTNGTEYVIASTLQPYTGHYFQTFDGNRYTGKTPQDGPNNRLIPNPYIELEGTPTGNTTDSQFEIKTIIPNTEDNSLASQYLSLIPLSKQRFLPQSNLTLPTDKDKSLGVFSRYFCKKNNELIYLETDKQTFTDLSSRSPKIAWDLYEPLTTLWYIKGNKETTYKANKGLVSVIEQRQKWYGFSKYLKEDFLKYYVGE